MFGNLNLINKGPLSLYSTSVNYLELWTVIIPKKKKRKKRTLFFAFGSKNYWNAPFQGNLLYSIVKTMGYHMVLGIKIL
jgi:hypothetical protein